jgi:hypothetical protein
LDLLRRGLWPVVLHPPGKTISTKDGPKVTTGKEPVSRRWGATRPTEAELRRLFRANPGAGVGISLGPDGGVVDIEVDGPEGEASLRRLCGGSPPPTSGWSSRRGPHRIYLWDDRLSGIDPRGRAKLTLPDLPGLELRLGQGRQAQSACPPTVGEDGMPRRWNDCTAIAPLPETALRFLRDKPACPSQGAPHETDGHADGRRAGASVDPAAAWFGKALENHAGNVARAPEGERHTALLVAARTLGGMLHHRYLGEGEIIAELTHAARRAGLPDGEIAETIRDGLAHGKASPLPWPDKLARPGAVARDGQHAGGDAPPGQPAVPDDGKETQAQALLRLAAPAELARTGEGRAFARVPVEGHYENHEIRSVGFRRWLTHAFYREQARPPSSDALQGSLAVLEAKAQFDAPTEPVFVRVATGANGTVVIDLGDASWRAVRVAADGWGLVERPAARFRRPSGLQALPLPERGGSIRDLRRFANVAKADLPLLVAWLTAALQSSGPYPILVLSGEQGSAKSTTARLLRRLVDPHVSPLRSEPKEPRDLMIGATNGWAVAYDNISSLSTWLSDAFCRLATGGGFATRQLYSDSEEVFLDAMRPVILTGIEDYVRRGDLADRCVFLHLPTIPEEGRRTEAEFWAALEAEYPRLFGAVLTAVEGGLRLLPEVRLGQLPRMADFARWGEAVCRSAGWQPGEFLNAYQRNRHDANEAALDDSPLAGAVRALMAGRSEWEGTPGALFDELCRLRPDHSAIKDRWPKTPRGLSGQLRRLAPALRAAGLESEFGRGRERHVRLWTVDPGERPSQPSQRAHDGPWRPRGDDGCPEGCDATGARPAHSNGCVHSPDVGCDGCDGRGPALTGGGREVFEL